MKKKHVIKPDARKDWKNEADDEIILMQENMDELADELGLSEETILKLEKIVDEFKERLHEVINLFEVTPEIATQTDDFMENFLDEINYDRIVAGDDDIDRMIEIVKDNKTDCEFIEIDSLAKRIKVDEFITEMAENPYQLKLIA